MIINQQFPSTFPKSAYFQLEKLADGVYAALAEEATGASQCNSAIIDLGNYTLIFDTFLTPKAAVDLKYAAEELTGRPASFVVNSHFHYDHWLGNQVFDERTSILASKLTRELIMNQAAPARKILMRHPDEYKLEVQRLESLFQRTRGIDQRKDLNTQMAWYQSQLEAFPSIRFRFPDHTFDSHLTIHGSQRRVELLSLGHGHTAGDAFLVLPKEKIAFMGDLLYVERHPLLSDSNPTGWLEIIQSVEEMELETLVPGHGPIGGNADITKLRLYIQSLEKSVNKALKKGRTLQEIKRLRIPIKFRSWPDPWGRYKFEKNLEFFFIQGTQIQ